MASLPDFGEPGEPVLVPLHQGECLVFPAPLEKRVRLVLDEYSLSPDVLGAINAHPLLSKLLQFTRDRPGLVISRSFQGYYCCFGHYNYHCRDPNCANWKQTSTNCHPQSMR